MQINNETIIERPDPFVSGISNKHGCIWFDDNSSKGPRDPNAAKGWACVGGENPFRFESISELPLDIIWWTNLTRAENWSFGKLKRFKESALFGIDLMALISENGLTTDKRSESVKYWSEIFSRSAEWLSRWCQRNNLEPWDWGEGTLSDALKKRILQNDQSNDQIIEYAFSKAYVEQIFCEVKQSDLQGKRQITLSLPRLKHAQKILSSKFPKNEWKILKENEWPRTTNERVRWITEKKLPMLVEVDLVNFKNLAIVENSSLTIGQIWLGKRGFRLNTQIMEPMWLTETELLALSKFATFEIISAYISSGWEELSNITDLHSTIEGPLIHLSITKGLLSTATWQAVSSPGRDPNNRRKGLFSPRAIWLRVVDRLSCFSAALIMQSNGYDVLSYGNGQVKVAFDPNGDPKDLAKTTQQAGLTLPTVLAERLKLPEIEDLTNIFNTMEGVAQIDQWLKQKWIKRKKQEDLKPFYLDIDRLMMTWSDKETINKTKLVLKNAILRLIGLSLIEKKEEKTNIDLWWEKMLREQAAASVEKIKNHVK